MNDSGWHLIVETATSETVPPTLNPTVAADMAPENGGLGENRGGRGGLVPHPTKDFKNILGSKSRFGVTW